MEVTDDLDGSVGNDEMVAGRGTLVECEGTAAVDFDAIPSRFGIAPVGLMLEAFPMLYIVLLGAEA